MADIFDLFEGYKKAMIWALGSSAILPVLGAFGGLSPIWPPAAVPLTSLFNMIALIFVSQFFRGKSKKVVNISLVVCLALAVLLLVLYLILFDLFVYTVPSTDHQILLGCGWEALTKEIATEFEIDPNSGCPGRFDLVLESAGYDPKIVWASQGLLLIRIGLLFAWLTFFFFVTALIGIFLNQQSNGKKTEQA